MSAYSPIQLCSPEMSRRAGERKGDRNREEKTRWATQERKGGEEREAEKTGERRVLGAAGG